MQYLGKDILAKIFWQRYSGKDILAKIFKQRYSEKDIEGIHTVQETGKASCKEGAENRPNVSTF